ncbi:transketolase [Candidatus Daviesbacteria bacterium RIFCSPHIGHO2_02_FULL_41_10]|uniref:Transketolase n=2 Tax=Candidatus Daviesiibacteriota TaxID=1752718 RepID=A0A1F5IRC3_9BACT|nr:MAG: transketolase [Candidatus Daviesbacteria bacterium RIFCSPHIGHO2_01_FULL_41_23]OGE33843.1 MAG: transketolase [Candidatus Daviesbacteria bacterium RIFCSPHIGHO2_02_FULL_41_10]OGE62110.1 MAG: transketolase [Candidatus Daviesbacteria bacterium RIFCSPLOWO2_01_FULL_41_32]
MNINKLEKLIKLLRYYILVSTSKAGSGHPTSSLSAAELMGVLMFGGFFRFDFKNKENPFNDRLIFSKGHASPLYYSLFTVANAITENELMTLRKFGSRLEGHPTMEFPFTEVPTGSLGQGLSAGLGMALVSKFLNKTNFKTFVLLGDSETAEGSVWEAMQTASFYKLDNLIAILDVNRLGQSRQTMLGHDVLNYKKKAEAFDWEAIVIDGNSIKEVVNAYEKALKVKGKPVMIIAKTLKGKGISFLENKENWHGKALGEKDLNLALEELGKVDVKLRGKVKLPRKVVLKKQPVTSNLKPVTYSFGETIATRKAYGNALVRIFPKYPEMVVMDGETSNSTYAEFFAKAYPAHYFEMFIAEQNMAGVAFGLSRQGKIPFISTFAAFFSRAFDQIRMAQYADTNIKFCGSHAGVSIGEDGASQMGLEDIGMFRSLLGSVVLYPSDGVSTDKLTEEAAKHKGVVYIRTTRKETPILYKANEKFPIGGSKTLRESKSDKVTVIGAGITLHEALSAYEELRAKGIFIRVIDLYSISPLDNKTLKKAAKETEAIITVEDHHIAGGLGEAVAAALSGSGKPVYIMAVTKMPHSGKPDELLEYEGISAPAIVKQVKKVIA